MLRACVQLLQWSATQDPAVIEEIGLCGAIKRKLLECSEQQFRTLVHEAASISSMNDHEIQMLRDHHEAQIRAEQCERQMRDAIFE